MQTHAFRLALASLLAFSINTSVKANSPEITTQTFALPDQANDVMKVTTTPSKDSSFELPRELLSDTFVQSTKHISIFGPWLTERGISQNAIYFISAIKDANSHGLDPEQYDLAHILLITDTLQKLEVWSRAGVSNPGNSSHDTITEDLRFKLSYLLDTNFVKFAKHLGQGIVDGPSIQAQLFRQRPKVEAFNMLVSINNAESSVEQALSSIAPSHPDYERLRDRMRDLLAEKATNVQRTRVDANVEATLVTEATDKHVIIRRLIEAGDLSFEAYGSNHPDEHLLKTLQAFQKRHGLQPDGILGKKTRGALNTTVEQDIEAVAMSLERWRWLPRELGKRHIIANIPSYSVKLVEDNKTRLSMRTVVGKRQHQTPSFTENMTYMEFNPTWTVPASITNNELLPIERRNPGYLASRNFDVIKRQGDVWNNVSVNSLTQAELNASKFPYALRQRSGSGNALGRMKFMMPNRYAIYLHDTPAQSLFTYTNRAYSHGCVRLSDPDALAQHLLLADGYTQNDIDKFTNAKKNVRINFRTPVPTHLVYLTTWVGENGELQKRPDLYKNDASLLDALKNAGTVIGDDINLARNTL